MGKPNQLDLFAAIGGTGLQAGTRAGRDEIQKKYSKQCRKFAAVLKKNFRGCGVYNIADRIAVVNERSAERFVAEKNPTDLDAVSLFALATSDHGYLVVQAILDECDEPWADKMRRLLRMGQKVDATLQSEIEEHEERLAEKQRIAAKRAR